MKKIKLNRIGFAVGAASAFFIVLIPGTEGMEETAWNTAAVAILMAIFWVTEAMPIYITALLPIVLFPVLGISSISESTEPFGHPLIFLFMGGFIIAQGIQKWGLHKRIALRIIEMVGVSPNKIILGFMIGSSFLSMWISNTATALMMLPIGLSVISLLKSADALEVKAQRKFSIALLLSIAYSCSIGGVATLIGTPPNALMAAFMLETYGIDISFAEWMLFGVPFALISLPITYLLLTKFLFKFNADKTINILSIRDEINKIGKISYEERIVQIVFLLTAVLWILRPLLASLIPGISDSSIAVFGALLLFLLNNKMDSLKYL